MPELETGIQVQQVIFGERMVEITYTEPRDQAADGTVLMVRSIAVDMGIFEEDIADLLDTVTQIVDNALVRVRNPQETARPRRA
jgi:hypothetical protein